MARTGQALSRLAAIVSLIPFGNGSVSDDGRVSSIYAPLPRTLTLLLVRNHFGNASPSVRSVCLKVNSSTRRKAAKASVNAVQVATSL